MSREPDIQDLRTEYAELSSNLRAGVTVLWDAFKTYFTISALLFGGAGVLLSGKSPFAPRVSVAAALVVAIAGAVITVLGGFGIHRIVAYQSAFLDRGMRVEAALGTELMKTAKRAWDRGASLRSAVGLTYVVFGLFGLGFVLVAVVSASCLACGSSCPQ